MEIWSLGALPGSFESSGSCPSHEKGRIRFGKTAAGFVVGKDFRSSLAQYCRAVPQHDTTEGGRTVIVVFQYNNRRTQVGTRAFRFVATTKPRLPVATMQLRLRNVFK